MTYNRENLHDLLKKYVAATPEEQKARELMLQFLETHADCFERSCIPGHFTASAWLLSPDMQRVLLMHHTKLNIWVQMGGHCDGDSDVLQVAIKEAQEESGLQNIVPVSNEIFDLDVHEIPARNHEPAHLHYDVRFLLRVNGSDAIVQNHESRELRWFTKDPHALPTQQESVVRMFRKWCAL